MKNLLRRFPWVLPSIAALVVGLPALGPVLRWCEQLELRSFDLRQATIQENRFHSGISVLEMDQASLIASESQKLFGRYPPRREIYGYLVRFLQRGGAKYLIMDQSFTGGRDLEHPESDATFAQSLTGSPPVASDLSVLLERDLLLNPVSDAEGQRVLWALRDQWIRFQGEKEVVKDVASRVYVHPAQGIQPPLSALLDTAMKFFPFQSVQYDANGRVRRTVLFGGFYQNRLILPMLAPGVLMGDTRDVPLSADGRIQFGPHKVDLKGETKPIIRWYGNMLLNAADGPERRTKEVEVYPRASLWHAVKSQLWRECQDQSNIQAKRPRCGEIDFKGFTPLDPAQFRDRWVFLGMTAHTIDDDNHATLYDDQNGQKYPGVYIQANILDNLLHNDFVARPGWRVHPFQPLEHALGLPRGTLAGGSRAWLPHESVSLVTVLTVLLITVFTVYSSFRWTRIHLNILYLFSMGGAYTYGSLWAYQHLNLWLNWVYPMMGLMLGFGGSFLVRYALTERRKQQLRLAFAKYVSPAAMAAIEKNPDKINLGGQRCEVTSLFCDIRGFTSFSEQNEPEVVQKILTEYFSVMNKIIIHTYGGSINKLMGDAIMAYWGFPLQNEDHAFLAVSAALAMKEAIEEWRGDPAKPPIHIGIGLNTGPVMIGNVGSEDFMDFTIIGDSVNIAARLEALNKDFGTTIIISADTYEKLKDRVEAQHLGSIRVRGKEMETGIYEPVRIIPADTPDPA